MRENDIFLSLVIPAYNEESRIASTLDSVEAYMESLGKPYEIVIVDDGSSDSTAEIAMERAVRSDSVRVVSYSNNAGKGCAVRQGRTGCSRCLYCILGCGFVGADC